MAKTAVWKEVLRLWHAQVVQDHGPQQQQQLAEVNVEYFIEQEAGGNGVAGDPPQVFVDLVEAYNKAIHERIGYLERFRDLALAELAKVTR